MQGLGNRTLALVNFKCKVPVLLGSCSANKIGFLGFQLNIWAIADFAIELDLF